MANLLALPVRIQDKIAPDPNGGCWLWTGYTALGYGMVHEAREGEQRHHRRLVAHRVVYELLHGHVESGLTLDHLCRVRSCVNPDHLEPVTRKENILRGFGVPARRARQTHCIRGHELSGPNLRLRLNGYRNCKACEVTADRARKARRRLVADGAH